ncbi:MAG: RtcB family protein, partial [Methanoregula sp.]|nr:RtcB family protein [Methanoregula sp.]
MLEGVNRCGENEWGVPVGYVPGMRVPARFFLSESLGATLEPGAVQQLANVATLPGIIQYALGMPDIHWGYGFPIGGVAAFSLEDGVVSPGGVGYDINCGVRLLRTNLLRADVQGSIEDLVNAFFRHIPSGVGSRRKDLKLSGPTLKEVMRHGAGWAVKNGFGAAADLDHLEAHGKID